MPSTNLEDVLATKPVTFKIKTGRGQWKCQIHSNRAAYERAKTGQATMPSTSEEAVPGITRTDTGLSSSSASTSSSH